MFFSEKHILFIASTIPFVIFPKCLQLFYSIHNAPSLQFISHKISIYDCKTFKTFLPPLKKLNSNKYVIFSEKQIIHININFKQSKKIGGSFTAKLLLALKTSFHCLQTPTFDVPKLSSTLKTQRRTPSGNEPLSNIY